MHIWDYEFPPQFELEAEQLEKELRHRCPFFNSIGSRTIVRCIYWIVSHDYEDRIQAKEKKGLRSVYGDPKQELEERARKINAIARKVEKYCPIIPFLPVPPIGVPEQLRAYAEELRQYIAAHNQNRPIGSAERERSWSEKATEALRFLVETTTEKTGRRHFQEIGDLLTEATELLGIRSEIPGRSRYGQRQPRRIYDPDTIKMRLKRSTHTAK
jgi:hypothetical protein